MIKIEHLSKSFGSNEVLDNLSLTLKPSTIYGLVGENGVGKSTLLRCLANIYQIDSGFISVSDLPLNVISQTNKQIFYVSDEPFFLANANLISMQRYYQIFYPSFDVTYYQWLLVKFELDEKMPITHFSKGMARQAALSLGLATRPNYLLLDEAFDGLDPYKRIILKQILIDEVINRSLTVVIASHNLKEINDFAEHLLILHHGQITLDRSISDLQTDYQKYQCAFKELELPSEFDSYHPLYVNQVGKVYTIVLKSDNQAALTYLKSLKPLLLEPLPLSLEELFIYYLEKEVPYVAF